MRSLAVEERILAAVVVEGIPVVESMQVEVVDMPSLLLH